MPLDDLPRLRDLVVDALAGLAGGQVLGELGDRFTLLLDSPHPADGPLLALRERLGLHPAELLAVALCAEVELDPDVGRQVAELQAPVGGSRPMLGPVARALAPVVGGEPAAYAAIIGGLAVRSGILVLTEPGAPLAECPLATPAWIALALAGQRSHPPGVGLETPEIALPPSLRASALDQGRALAAGRGLVIRSGSTLDARAVADGVVRAQSRQPAFMDKFDTVGLGPWLLLTGRVPVLTVDPGPGERLTVQPPSGYDGAIVVICGPDGSVTLRTGGALVWTLPVPSPPERAQLWEISLGEPTLAAALGAEHRHGVGQIALLGDLARHAAALDSPPRAPVRADVLAASWSGSGLDSLADPIRDVVPDQALVLPPGVTAELQLLLLRCKNREGLGEGLGESTRVRLRAGVRALLVGPSGTGKTLAAGWLATRLGMPLYRVDMAGVISKYIGETEKNLAQLLARAEQAEVVLLFDEADSLFGKRTEIQHSNDRFANAQTNYLLQRIESYDGICLLTANSRGRFDSSFFRRLDLVIEFPSPGATEQRALWRAHLGTGHSLTPEDFNRLAATGDLVGGHIRNAVLSAAVLARAGGRTIAWEDVIRGVEIEYRKLGRQVPAALRG